MENKSIQILNEIKKVIVGKDEVITKTLMAILAGGHVLLEDVPGVGKTTLALAFSRAMNLSEKRIQFTPDTMASDIIGFSVYNKATGAAYVKMLSMEDKNALVAKALTEAAGYPCQFRAAIEGTVAESDKSILAAQEAAKKQTQDNLNKVFEMFGRENTRVMEE